MRSRLRVTLLGLCALVLSAAVSGSEAAPQPTKLGPARITAEKRTSPRVLVLTISTPAFATPTHVAIDLPSGYDQQPHRRWPVTYFLAGTMNTYNTFNSLIDGVGLTKDYPSILVSPNGDSGYWSDWFNDGKLGTPMYESYVIDQLIPLIDQHFRTIPDRAHRAIFGASMGGFGSMMIAARHPDLFQAAATMSGAVDSNLIPQAAVLSVSPTFQGAGVDAIFGPKATQEVRWHGHNPTDLATNLRGMDLQVRTATGVPNPGIGENLLSADSVSCIVEGGVHMASVSFHRALLASKIPHLWKDYGPGCHTPPNFTREVKDILAVFTKDFAHPASTPSTFDYLSIEPTFDVWGWHVANDKARALELLELQHVNRKGLTVAGSGTVTLTTPPWFKGRTTVTLSGATARQVRPDAAGRIRFSVDLGTPDTDQQYTPGARTTATRRAISFSL